jgi:hypothetical protein
MFSTLLLSLCSMPLSPVDLTLKTTDGLQFRAGEILLADHKGGSALDSLILAKGEDGQLLSNLSLCDNNLIGLLPVTDKDDLSILGETPELRGKLHAKAIDGLSLIGLATNKGDSFLSSQLLPQGAFGGSFLGQALNLTRSTRITPRLISV